MTGTSRRSYRWALVPVVAAGLLVSGCGGGGSKSSSSPSAAPSATASAAATLSAAAVQQITQNWQTFFSKDTPVAQKVALLQNGQAMQPAITAFANDPRMKQAAAKVTSVTGSDGTATVHYQVSLNGQVMLPDAVGQAVNENGTWKVGDQTLCGLLALAATGGQKIPGCS